MTTLGLALAIGCTANIQNRSQILASIKIYEMSEARLNSYAGSKSIDRVAGKEEIERVMTDLLAKGDCKLINAPVVRTMSGEVFSLSCMSIHLQERTNIRFWCTPTDAPGSKGILLDTHWRIGNGEDDELNSDDKPSKKDPSRKQLVYPKQETVFKLKNGTENFLVVIEPKHVSTPEEGD